MCYDAELGCLKYNHVRINSGELAKLGSAMATPPWDGGRGG